MLAPPAHAAQHTVRSTVNMQHTGNPLRPPPLPTTHTLFLFFARVAGTSRAPRLTTTTRTTTPRSRASSCTCAASSSPTTLRTCCPGGLGCASIFSRKGGLTHGPYSEFQFLVTSKLPSLHPRPCFSDLWANPCAPCLSPPNLNYTPLRVAELPGGPRGLRHHAPQPYLQPHPFTPSILISTPHPPLPPFVQVAELPGGPGGLRHHAPQRVARDAAAARGWVH